MLSASFWTLVFIAVVAATMSLRKRIRNHNGIGDWYERELKSRLDLIKKIVIYGTLILWIGIWLATRGDEKSSFGDLIKDVSKSWSKQENPNPSPTIRSDRPTQEKK